MAYQQYSTLLLALLLIGTTCSLAHGYTVNGTPIQEIRVSGRVFCSSSGNPTSGSAALVGATVYLSRDAGQTSLAQAVTGSQGSYTIVVTEPNIGDFDTNTYYAVVVAPVANCAALSSFALLRAPLSVSRVDQTSSGAVAIISAGSFEIIG